MRVTLKIRVKIPKSRLRYPNNIELEPIEVEVPVEKDEEDVCMSLHGESSNNKDVEQYMHNGKWFSFESDSIEDIEQNRALVVQQSVLKNYLSKMGEMVDGITLPLDFKMFPFLIPRFDSGSSTTLSAVDYELHNGSNQVNVEETTKEVPMENASDVFNDVDEEVDRTFEFLVEQRDSEKTDRLVCGFDGMPIPLPWENEENEGDDVRDANLSESAHSEELLHGDMLYCHPIASILSG